MACPLVPNAYQMYSAGNSLAIQSNGDIVLGGDVFDGTKLDMAVVRYSKVAVTVDENCCSRIQSVIYQMESISLS